jgi:hypothetical protein
MVGTMPAECTHIVFGCMAAHMNANKITSNYVNGVGKLLGPDASEILFGTTIAVSIVGHFITDNGKMIFTSISKKNC